MMETGQRPCVSVRSGRGKRPGNFPGVSVQNGRGKETGQRPGVSVRSGRGKETGQRPGVSVRSGRGKEIAGDHMIGGYTDTFPILAPCNIQAGLVLGDPYPHWNCLAFVASGIMSQFSEISSCEKSTRSSGAVGSDRHRLTRRETGGLRPGSVRFGHGHPCALGLSLTPGRTAARWTARTGTLRHILSNDV